MSRASGVDFGRQDADAHRLHTQVSPKCMKLERIRQRARVHNRPMTSRHWVNGWEATAIITCAILLNAVLVGIEVEVFMFSRRETPAVFENVIFSCEVILHAIFAVEFVLRIRGGQSTYLCSWVSVFDFVMLTIGWLFILQWKVPLSSESKRTIASIRVFRIARLTRLVHLSSELELLIYGLMKTAAAVFWAMIFMAVFVLLGALFCADVLAHDEHEVVRMRFGSVWASLYTHMQLVFVDAWPAIMGDLVEESWLWALYGVAFVLMSNIMLLNVVTGVICEEVLALSNNMPPKSHDKVEMIQCQEEELLRELFGEADVNEDGTLSREEYLQLAKSHDMQILFKQMKVGMPLDQTELHMVLDYKGTGSLTVEQWLRGVERLQGSRDDKLSEALHYDLLTCSKHLAHHIIRCRRASKMRIQSDTLDVLRRFRRRLGRRATELEEAQRDSAKAVVWPEVELASRELMANLEALRCVARDASTAARQSAETTAQVRPQLDAATERMPAATQTDDLVPVSTGIAGLLQVRVLSVRGLQHRGASLFRDIIDPYVVVRAGATQYQTEVVVSSTNPEWNSETCFRFPLNGDDRSVELSVLNASTAHAGESLGTVRFQLLRLLPGHWYQLKEPLKRNSNSELEFQMRVDRPPGWVLPPGSNVSSPEASRCDSLDVEDPPFVEIKSRAHSSDSSSSRHGRNEFMGRLKKGQLLESDIERLARQTATNYEEFMLQGAVAVRANSLEPLSQSPSPLNSQRSSLPWRWSRSPATTCSTSSLAIERKRRCLALALSPRHPRRQTSGATLTSPGRGLNLVLEPLLGDDSHSKPCSRSGPRAASPVHTVVNVGPSAGHGTSAPLGMNQMNQRHQGARRNLIAL